MPSRCGLAALSHRPRPIAATPIRLGGTGKTHNRNSESAHHDSAQKSTTTKQAIRTAHTAWKRTANQTKKTPSGAHTNHRSQAGTAAI